MPEANLSHDLTSKQDANGCLAHLLCALSISIDAKTINLLRGYELQIDFLKRRLGGRLIPNSAERARIGS